MKILKITLLSLFIILLNSTCYSAQKDIIKIAVNGSQQQLIDALNVSQKSFILRKTSNYVYDVRDIALYLSIQCKRLENAEILIKNGARLKEYSSLECNQANRSNALKEIIEEEKNHLEDEAGRDPFVNSITDFDKGKVDLNILELLFRNDKWYCNYESMDLGGSYYDSLLEEIKKNKNSDAKKEFKIYKKYCR